MKSKIVSESEDQHAYAYGSCDFRIDDKRDSERKANEASHERGSARIFCVIK